MKFISYLPTFYKQYTFFCPLRYLMIIFAGLVVCDGRQIEYSSKQNFFYIKYNYNTLFSAVLPFLYKLIPPLNLCLTKRLTFLMEGTWLDQT